MNLHDQAETYLQQALDDPRARFRGGQWEAIEFLVQEKGQLLVVQRTGWGKSVVYFLATRLLRDRGMGYSLLISPLIALMRNQLEAAKRLGIRAETINSSNRDNWQEVKSKILADEVDLLLISPERLANEDFRETVLIPTANRVGLFAVDEAHCISDWGHDFRPDYKRIVRVLQALPPNIPTLATTATANGRVVNDILKQLGRKLRVIRGPLARSSLRLQNISLPDQAARLAWLAENVPQMPGSGIIYTLTIRDAQRVAEWLRSQEVDAYCYWGGLDSEKRVKRERQLLANEIKALVATTALGMGFDKPDLGFVIHYQRPGSVVHYYQQVGRAGRAIDEAYGVLLSGEEDKAIVDYFIETAFPPERDAELVLNELEKADSGLSVPSLERQVNLRHRRIEKVLKLLAVQTPAPVSKQSGRWYRNPVPYVRDQYRIDKLTQTRRSEQEQMSRYVHSEDCLMAFLQKELDDPRPVACGRCAACLGRPLLPTDYSFNLVNDAVRFLRRSDQVISPRKLWPKDALLDHDWTGTIAGDLRAEEGRSLGIWGDVGWGSLVKKGKQEDGHFDERLVDAVVDLLNSRWCPDPAPSWITYVPSLRKARLVPNFARRLADRLNLPLVPSVAKVHQNKPQKLMNNSYQQAINLSGAFRVRRSAGMDRPVLLVDDVVDSRWTFTVVTALLREAGSGPVYPLALAMIIGGWD